MRVFTYQDFIIALNILGAEVNEKGYCKSPANPHEKTPSFKVYDRGVDSFCVDYSTDGRKINFFELVKRYFVGVNATWREIHQKIDEILGEESLNITPLKLSHKTRRPLSFESKREVLEYAPLSDTTYNGLIKRGISPDVLEWQKEVIYSFTYLDNQNRECKGVKRGLYWKSLKGAINVRGFDSNDFKGIVNGKASISAFGDFKSSAYLIFEGYVDYLSHLSKFGALKVCYIVLNSVSFANQANALIKKYKPKRVAYFGDNVHSYDLEDRKLKGGDLALYNIKKEIDTNITKIIDYRVHFMDYLDYNDYHIDKKRDWKERD